ncbi:MAG: Flp family type IVb pilin [Actinomycetota bacterium]|nr:Flp family type IVb pilin [Actinomycetota bacterium]
MLKLFVAIQNKVAQTREEEGQTMAEYGVVLALITLAVVATIGFLGTEINNAFQGVLDAIK